MDAINHHGSDISLIIGMTAKIGVVTFVSTGIQPCMVEKKQRYKCQNKNRILTHFCMNIL